MSATSRTPWRIFSSVAALAGLLGGAIIAAGGASTQAHAGAAPHVVYTVVELRRDLTRAPAVWLGRVVWVRARPVQVFAWTCRHDYLCVVRQPSLADPTVDAADARLPLALPVENPALARARHAPLVGALIARLAPVQTTIWGTVGLYRIQLVAPPSCTDGTCVEARLMSAT